MNVKSDKNANPFTTYTINLLSNDFNINPQVTIQPVPTVSQFGIPQPPQGSSGFGDWSFGGWDFGGWDFGGFTIIPEFTIPCFFNCGSEPAPKDMTQEPLNPFDPSIPADDSGSSSSEPASPSGGGWFGGFNMPDFSMPDFSIPDFGDWFGNVPAVPAAPEPAVPNQHIYPPNILMGTVDPNITHPNITLISPSIIPNQDNNTVITSWNNEHIQAHPQKITAQSSLYSPAPILNDAINYEPAVDELPAPNQSLIYGATFYDTSEYFIGSTSVGLIFPENNITWTSEQEVKVITEIRHGLDWWIEKEPNASLSFIYDIQYSVPTKYEPTTLRGVTDSPLWINETLSYLNHSNFSDYYMNILDYDNTLRSRYRTDWAYTIFVVQGQYFSDNLFAYAYLGGGAVVMTYNNNGYGIENMDAVIAHETGHIFYANDQYSSANSPCTERTGYFSIENQNSQQSCLSDVPSIMRGGITPFANNQLDQYARKQLGWIDENNNSVLDVLDFIPSITITNSTISTSSRFTLPNLNPYSYTKSPITINRIKTIEYSLNNDLSWIVFSTPNSNNITITYPALPQNVSNISFRSKTNYGLFSNITITVLDNQPPELVITNVSGENYINITVTASEPLSLIILEWNGTNQTIPSNFNKTDLQNGVYSYRVFASDLSNNLNTSDMFEVTINKTTIIPAPVSTTITFIPNLPDVITPVPTPAPMSFSGGSYQPAPTSTPAPSIINVPHHPVMLSDEVPANPTQDSSTPFYLILFAILLLSISTARIYLLSREVEPSSF